MPRCPRADHSPVPAQGARRSKGFCTGAYRRTESNSDRLVSELGAEPRRAPLRKRVVGRRQFPRTGRDALVNSETGKNQSGPPKRPPVPKEIGLEETRLWLAALYGATMIAVQRLEFSVSFLYLVGNCDPPKSSGNAQRQMRKGLARLWDSLNKGTAPMKLNDAKKGVGHQLDEKTRVELSKFLEGPRNRLAHRFLIQAMPALGDGGVIAMAPHVIELIEFTQAASALADKVWARGMELVEELPDVEPPPPWVQERLDKLVEAVSLGNMGPESFAGDSGSSPSRPRG